MVDRLRGAELHRTIKQTAWVQGVQAPLGVATVIPVSAFTGAPMDFFLRTMDRARSREAVRCFLGTVGDGRGRLVVLGVDFDININERSITWLATARWPLIVTNVLVLDFWTQGYYL